jgi:hypothetical protein
MTDPDFKSRDCYRADGMHKHRYHPKRAAKLAARQLGPGYRVYRCPFCGGWHVGHRPDYPRPLP